MRTLAFFACLLAPAMVRADLVARVVDVGAGLCVVIDVPNAGLVVYDAGHWNGGRCAAAVADATGNQARPIHLLVLSHTDSDHLGDVSDLLATGQVERVLRTGYRRAGNWAATYREAMAAIATAGNTTRDINLARDELLPGSTWQFGDAFFTFVAGWSSPPGDWHVSTESHRINSVSVVLKVAYAGRTILVAGDTVGRGIGDPDDTCEAAEAAMVARAAAIPLRSDVLVAPHHGADNASSACFIAAVDPTWVIFSAGHRHHHPRAAAAQRYLNYGVPLANIFRTDRGDNEGDEEWDHEASTTPDGPGDDDVTIRLTDTGEVNVTY